MNECQPHAAVECVEKETGAGGAGGGGRRPWITVRMKILDARVEGFIELR